MTRALNLLNNADDIGSEAERPQEAPRADPVDPVIPEPAPVPQSRIAQMVEINRVNNEKRAAYVREQREHLDNALSASEPDRVELQQLSDDIINSVVVVDENAKAVANIAARLLAERQEMMRNVRDAIGFTVADVANVGADVETFLTNVVGGYGALLEVIRTICAEAGTVRVDELTPVFDSEGKFSIVRRFVDVGDEEPGQDPILDLKWVIPAGVKAAYRFKALRHEHNEANKKSANLQIQLEEASSKLASTQRDLMSERAKVMDLSGRVNEQMPVSPDSPEGYYLRAANGRWVCEAQTSGPVCFLTKWLTTKDMTQAYRFDNVADAQETLLRLQMARFHRVRKTTRETLKVITVRFEDHSS